MRQKCKHGKWTKKVVLLSALLSVGSFPAFLHADVLRYVDEIGQQFGRVTGKVMDVNGEPIPGVTVQVKGTAKGSVTDIDGNFSVEVQKGEELIVSFIGYVTQTVEVEGDSTLNIVLLEAVNQLDELVVVSYGTQKKRDLTGSVTKVDASKLSDMPVGQFAQKLQGQVPGVQITQSTGQPGKGMSFRIRGAASINAGNQPLFVIDGLPTDMDLSNINPDEIESFSVLKDAAASSL